MKNHEKSKKSSYIQYSDANSLYAWAMSQKLPVNGFKWVGNVSKIEEDFIKNCDEDEDIGYFLEVDVKYPENLVYLHSDLTFLPERMKINKCCKLICSLHDKNKYVVHTRALNKY